jgi:hypothetical protein
LGRPRLLLLCTQLIDKGDPLWHGRKVTIDLMVDRLMTWVRDIPYNMCTTDPCIGRDPVLQISLIHQGYRMFLFCHLEKMKTGHQHL